MDIAIRRALRRVVRTIEKIEPHYRRALEQEDRTWFAENFTQSASRLLEDIVHLAELAGNAPDDDIKALIPTLNASCIFMAALCEITGEQDREKEILGLIQ